MKKQSKADKMDESLGMRRGKESTKSQSLKSRRDESKGESKGMKKFWEQESKEKEHKSIKKVLKAKAKK